jgi:hypothetical protein
MKLIDWISTNSEWLFQGLGVTILIGIASLIFKKKASQFISKSKNVTQIGGDVHINDK